MKTLILSLMVSASLFGNIINIQASGLYWRPNTRGLEYAKVDEQYKTPNASFNLGSLVSVGITSPCREWMIRSAWLHLMSEAKGICEDEPQVSPVSTYLSFEEQQIKKITSRWFVQLDFIDCVSGQFFWKYNELELCPLLGLRFANMDQSFWIEHELKNRHINVEQTNQFRGGGILAGIEPAWHFKPRVSLFGHFAGSLLFGKISLSKNEVTDRIATSFSDFRLFIDSSIGIRHYIRKKQEHNQMTTTLSLDYHIFVDQKRYWKNFRTIPYPIRGDLSFLGLSFVFELGF